LILHRVASPSLLNHGRVGLDRVRGHARSPAKPRELGVHDGAELARCCMPEDPASPVQARGGGIRRGLCSILRAGVWCCSTPISPLFAVVLWLRTASLDPLGGLTH
jgi:hypothetical protein